MQWANSSQTASVADMGFLRIKREEKEARGVAQLANSFSPCLPTAARASVQQLSQRLSAHPCSLALLPAFSATTPPHPSGYGIVGPSEQPLT